MAFEEIVKRQIKKLLQPALKCVDMVSTELGTVVQKCSAGVSLAVCVCVCACECGVVFCVDGEVSTTT